MSAMHSSSPLKYTRDSTPVKQPFSEPLNFFLQKTVLDYRPHQKRINHLIDLGGGGIGWGKG